MPDPNPNPNPTPAVVPGDPNPPAPQPAPTPPASASAENNTIRQMRDQIEAEKTQRLALETKIKDLERKDMDALTKANAELEDARRQLGELTPASEEAAKYRETITRACASELAGLTDDQKVTIEALTKHAPLTERLDAIIEAKKLIAAPARIGGTATNPGNGIPPAPGNEPAKPVDPKDINKMSWKTALGSRGNPQSAVPPDLSQTIQELQAQVKQLQAK